MKALYISIFFISFLTILNGAETSEDPINKGESSDSTLAKVEKKVVQPEYIKRSKSEIDSIKVYREKRKQRLEFMKNVKEEKKDSVKTVNPIR